MIQNFILIFKKIKLLADQRVPIIESISSKKIVLGAKCRAISNNTRTNFSESPLHLETIELAEILKNVVLHSVATALANIVLPVPGGPNNKTPFHGSSKPVKKCGYLKGIKTASFSNRFACSSPTISLNDTSGFLMQISLCRN